MFSFFFFYSHLIFNLFLNIYSFNSILYFNTSKDKTYNKFTCLKSVTKFENASHNITLNIIKQLCLVLRAVKICCTSKHMMCIYMLNVFAHFTDKPCILTFYMISVTFQILIANLRKIRFTHEENIDEAFKPRISLLK